MKLLQINIETGKIEIDPYFATIPEINKLYKKDIRYLSAIAFLINYDSPFHRYPDKEKRILERLKLESIDFEDFRIAIDIYKEEYVTIEYELHIAAVEAVKKSKDFLATIDYSLMFKGKPVWSPKEVFAIIKEIPGVAKSLEDSMQRLEEGMKSKAIMAKGKREISRREDPNDKNTERI